MFSTYRCQLELIGGHCITFYNEYTGFIQPIKRFYISGHLNPFFCFRSLPTVCGVCKCLQRHIMDLLPSLLLNGRVDPRVFLCSKSIRT